MLTYISGGLHLKFWKIFILKYHEFLFLQQADKICQKMKYCIHYKRSVTAQ